MRDIDYWVVKVQYSEGEKEIRCESEQAGKQALQKIMDGLKNNHKFVGILDDRAVVTLTDLQTATVEPRYGRPSPTRYR